MSKKTTKYVIVGGVASGATAAARIRRVDEFAQILLLERGKYISYANCGLPYYVGGVIAEREQLLLQTPELFSTRFNVDARVETEVVNIHPTDKTLVLRTAQGKEYQENYDKLLLSPGAYPFKPPLEGVGLEGIFMLRDVEDSDKIKTYFKANNVKKVVVVGAGFVGLETTENLHLAGAEVSIVEIEDQILAPVDFSIAAHVAQHLLQKGVHLHLNQTITHFSRSQNQLEVHLKNGQTLKADMVILSVGVRPEISLAQKAGLKIGEAGGIWVNKFLQTSDENIYAAGDAIEFPHPLTGKPWLNYLAGPASRQAHIAADNMVRGNMCTYPGSIGTSIAKVFDMTVATTGLAAKHLQQLGIPYESATIHVTAHASYYPKAPPICVKMTFHPQNGTLYGAQCVGFSGVDKCIDKLAWVVQKKESVETLIHLEHAYSPPFSSARDVTTIAGYVASNVLHKTMPVFTWEEVANLNLEKDILVDVRTPAEFERGAIQGAVNIPVDTLRNRLAELPKDKPIYIYCGVGKRGYLAVRILMANGYSQVKNLSGGYTTYAVATAPVVAPKT
ncbi:MAG: FAD-dependent oxidoreductase [Proteobacteria bacterium]|nr:FAD-dependent oxidoreductase [Cystobacterineae bacterium]MCL2258283.1 FAD-dependent oxidoreductase [Cystobacterineae bacterium]MCL2315372.1 FAD-dependent oxidoreductase [Pseudomonadota bacterium]